MEPVQTPQIGKIYILAMEPVQRPQITKIYIYLISIWGSVISQFQLYYIKIVHDVNIVIKSWWGAQGQGPAINLVFYVSVIKIDADGSHVIEAQYKMKHHVNMQFNKIPTTSYAMQQEMGHDFHKE